MHRQPHPVTQGVAEGLAIARRGNHLPGQGITLQAVHTGLESGLGQGLSLGRGRAAGGPVNAGQAYMVGERGPELFIPPTAGMISPNAGGRSITQVFNISPGVDAGTIYRAAQMGASMAKSDIARGMRIGEMG
jgi:hypothetical protein